MSYNYIKKPKVNKPYISLKYSEEEIAKEKRREERAKRIGLNLYILDDESAAQLVKLENHILETYLDNDKDVPDDVIKEYTSLKDKVIEASMTS